MVAAAQCNFCKTIIKAAVDISIKIDDFSIKKKIHVCYYCLHDKTISEIINVIKIKKDK